MENSKKYDREKEARLYQKIKISKSAYNRLKEISSAPEYRGKKGGGLIGAVDMMVLGHRTTPGSGRLVSDKKNQKKSESVEKNY